MVYCLAPPSLHRVSLDHLPRDDTTHDDLVTSISIINEENAQQAYPQANLMYEFPPLRFSLPKWRLSSWQKTIQHKYLVMSLIVYPLSRAIVVGSSLGPISSQLMVYGQLISCGVVLKSESWGNYCNFSVSQWSKFLEDPSPVSCIASTFQHYESYLVENEDLRRVPACLYHVYVDMVSLSLGSKHHVQQRNQDWWQ